MLVRTHPRFHAVGTQELDSNFFGELERALGTRDGEDFSRIAVARLEVNVAADAIRAVRMAMETWANVGSKFDSTRRRRLQCCSIRLANDANVVEADVAFFQVVKGLRSRRFESRGRFERRDITSVCPAFALVFG